MDLILAILGFTFVATITPGPNNLMVMASGANFGYARTIPHMLGITAGFPVLVMAVGLGMGVVFDRFPALHPILKWGAFAYLLYLAWRIATAGRVKAGGDPGARPLSFLGAAAFQWINPKAWAMALGAVPLFTTPEGNHVLEVARIALIFGLVCYPCISLWCLFGGAMSRFLYDDRRLRIFNVTMAALMVASIVPNLFEKPAP